MHIFINCVCFRIYLVGFPDIHETSDAVPVVKLIPKVVPEAVVLSHDIYPKDTVPTTSSAEAQDGTCISADASASESRGDEESEDRGENMKFTGAGDLNQPIQRSDSADADAGDIDTTQSQDSTSEVSSKDLFCPAWIESEALKLLTRVQQNAHGDDPGALNQVLLSGYGFGGVIIKQVRL